LIADHPFLTEKRVRRKAAQQDPADLILRQNIHLQFNVVRGSLVDPARFRKVRAEQRAGCSRRFFRHFPIVLHKSNLAESWHTLRKFFAQKKPEEEN
jgi:hypothetical protein